MNSKAFTNAYIPPYRQASSSLFIMSNEPYQTSISKYKYSTSNSFYNARANNIKKRFPTIITSLRLTKWKQYSRKICLVE